MKVYKVTHNSGLWCIVEAKNSRELEQKLASGLYSILPIGSKPTVRLIPQDIIKVERVELSN